MKKYIISLVAALSGCVLVKDGPEATENASQFARSTLGWHSFSVTCQDYDSDGDGYVSCTAVKQDTTREIVPLECTGYWSWNDGCRIATGKAIIHNHHGE